MAKKKKPKPLPFDNSISKITENLSCPGCFKEHMIFMYTRKRTNDEVFLCRYCETIHAVSIEINYKYKFMKKL